MLLGFSSIKYVIVTSSEVWGSAAPRPPVGTELPDCQPTLAPVGVKSLHVVVLSSSKAASSCRWATGWLHRGASVGRGLLAGIRETLSKPTQVLSIPWGEGKKRQRSASSVLHGAAEVQIQDLTPLPPPTQSQEHKPFDLTQKGELLLSVLHLICLLVQEENSGGVQRCRFHF